MNYLIIDSKLLNEKIILLTNPIPKVFNILKIKHPRLARYTPEEIDLLYGNYISKDSIKEIHRIKKSMKGTVISAELIKGMYKKFKKKKEEIF